MPTNSPLHLQLPVLLLPALMLTSTLAPIVHGNVIAERTDAAPIMGKTAGIKQKDTKMKLPSKTAWAVIILSVDPSLLLLDILEEPVSNNFFIKFTT